jgi:type IV secretory pathway TrbL component
MLINVVLVLTPLLVGGGWTAISAAAVGAAVALGLTLRTAAKEEVAAEEEVPATNAAEVEVTGEDATQSITAMEAMVLSKGDIEVQVKRDARGRLTVCASGRNRTKAELKVFAEEFTQKMTQCFVYNRVMTELKARGFQVLSEERSKDDTINIRVRRWEG